MRIRKRKPKRSPALKSKWFRSYDKEQLDPFLVGSHTVVVDHGADLEKLIDDADCRWLVGAAEIIPSNFSPDDLPDEDFLRGFFDSSGKVTPSSFPPDQEFCEVVETVEVHLLSFPTPLISDDPLGRTGVKVVNAIGAYWKLRKLGFRPATVRELILLAGKREELATYGSSIIAMGSRLEYPDGYEFPNISFRNNLEFHTTSCQFRTIAAGADWLGLCLFAAVKEEDTMVKVPEIPLSWL